MGAPPEVDLVALLVGEGVDSRRHVPAALVGISWFLRLHCTAEAQFDLFRDFRGPLFDRWAAGALAPMRG